MEASYQPPWWYRGRHLQTIWGPLFRRLRRPPLCRERWPTPDGDFLDLDWLDGDSPLVVILHGLEGSSGSHYARGLLLEAAALGWRAVVFHFRSCSGELNRGPRLYHAGETSDLDWVIGKLIEREPTTPLGLVGVSLGGNVALKWLGERGEGAPAQVRAAATISTPFDLTACAESLDRGLNRPLYTARFLRSMRAKVRAKRRLYDGLVNVPAALRARTFAVYDRLATAPINGFADERDYWARQQRPVPGAHPAPLPPHQRRERSLRPDGHAPHRRGRGLSVAGGGVPPRRGARGISRRSLGAPLLGRAAGPGIPPPSAAVPRRASARTRRRAVSRA